MYFSLDMQNVSNLWDIQAEVLERFGAERKDWALKATMVVQTYMVQLKFLHECDGHRQRLAKVQGIPTIKGEEEMEPAKIPEEQRWGRKKT